MTEEEQIAAFLAEHGPKVLPPVTVTQDRLVDRFLAEASDRGRYRKTIGVQWDRRKRKGKR